ncbi:unnamed protein product [Clonostachys rosea f. rosea IK726]|uniref:Uncharacterized protein n=1 Tax=Clonostachys rosea f. rosea IK726 TaxID=1349383 RepID=A0ACA9U0Q7_BIOOC|nr:unnamed protein product [Clonostachys rosea f. rosea IK726]
MDLGMAGCMFSVRFWVREAKINDKFMFQGSLDDHEMFRTERERDVEIDEGGSTSVGSTDSPFMDYSLHLRHNKVQNNGSCQSDN